MTSHLLTGVRPYGEDPTDILITDTIITAIGPDAAILTVDLGALVANWRLLAERAGAQTGAVVKADGKPMI